MHVAGDTIGAGGLGGAGEFVWIKSGPRRQRQCLAAASIEQNGGGAGGVSILRRCVEFSFERVLQTHVDGEAHRLPFRAGAADLIV